MRCGGGLLVMFWEREREEGGACFVGGGEKGGTLKAGDTEKATDTYYIESIPRPFKSPFAPFISSFLFFSSFFPLLFTLDEAKLKQQNSTADDVLSNGKKIPFVNKFSISFPFPPFWGVFLI